MNHRMHAGKLVGLHHRGLVQQHQVAELDLLHHEAFQVFLVVVAKRQGVAAAELTLHAQRVHHSGYAVQFRIIVAVGVLRAELRYGAYSLGDRSRLADAAGLDHYVIEAVLAGDFIQLLHQVHLERAAYAAVLQRHQGLVFLAHDTALFDEGSVDIYGAEIVHNHGELDTLVVGQDTVQEGCFAAAEITCEQQHRSVFGFVHIFNSEQ